MKKLLILALLSLTCFPVTAEVNWSSSSEKGEMCKLWLMHVAFNHTKEEICGFEHEASFKEAIIYSRDCSDYFPRDIEEYILGRGKAAAHIRYNQVGRAAYCDRNTYDGLNKSYDAILQGNGNVKTFIER
jgi:hypothetical protein